jgi:hypothetical protein
MNLLVIVLGSAAIVGVAYWLYGGLLVRLLKLDPNAKTPAVELRDDTDYVPIMYVMSVWALVLIAKEKLYTAEGFKLTADPVPWVALVLIGLAGLMLMEGILALSKGPSTPPSVGAVPAPAERTGLRAPMA